MEKIDANWLKRRLTGEWGEQTRLAELLDLTPDKVAKMIKGTRRIQADEALKLQAYFGDHAARSDLGALGEATKDMSDTQILQLIQYARFLKEQENNSQPAKPTTGEKAASLEKD